MNEPLPRAFFARDAATVARALLGCRLIHGEVTLAITEVEAYLGPADSACHTAAGRTARNAAMWGPPGRAYVYRCYGLHWMLNVVTGSEGDGCAVLIRAARPLSGADTVAARRGGRTGPEALAGPARVAQALGLDRSFDHHDLTEALGLWLAAGEAPRAQLSGPRVGIDYARPVDRDAPLRFAEAGSPWVSHRRRLSTPV